MPRPRNRSRRRVRDGEGRRDRLSRSAGRRKGDGREARRDARDVGRGQGEDRRRCAKRPLQSIANFTEKCRNEEIASHPFRRKLPDPPLGEREKRHRHAPGCWCDQKRMAGSNFFRARHRALSRAAWFYAQHRREDDERSASQDGTQLAPRLRLRRALRLHCERDAFRDARGRARR